MEAHALTILRYRTIHPDCDPIVFLAVEVAAMAAYLAGIIAVLIGIPLYLYVFPRIHPWWERCYWIVCVVPMIACIGLFSSLQWICPI